MNNCIKTWTIITFFIILILSISPRLYADIKFEYEFAGSYTDNLFMDNSNTEDFNTGNKLLISYYPIPKVKIEMQGYYTYYSQTYGLSNFAGTFDLTYLPLSNESSFSIYCNAKYSPTLYNSKFKGFNNNTMEFRLAGTYLTKVAGEFRAGGSIAPNIYTNDNEIGYDEEENIFYYPSDHDLHKIYMGWNSSFLKNNSIDIEAGYITMFMNYIFNPLEFENIPPRDYLMAQYDIIEEIHVAAYYFSPRFSRPIGNKNGISIVYNYRKFKNIDEVVLPGISTGFLSPWANVYDGNSVTFSIKSFMIPNVIFSTGVGYFDKLYIPSERTREESDPAPPSGINAPRIIYQRNDWQVKTFMSLKRPIPFKSGLFMEPAIQVNYNENKSNDPLYRYTSFSLTLGLTVRF